MLSWAQRLATFSHSAWIVGSFRAFRWCFNSTMLLVSSFFMVLKPPRTRIDTPPDSEAEHELPADEDARPGRTD